MTNLPALITQSSTPSLPAIAAHEQTLLNQAGKLFDAGFPDHALLDIWNASIHNLRRRVESYGVDIFVSTVKDQPGRQKYDKNGESIPDRWGGVDDAVLVAGATRLGLLNKKAGKSLEMINWMRNHASPAHDSDAKVENEDVFAFALMLQKNLFEHPMPDPGHSPSGLFEPVKSTALDEEGFTLLNDQITAFKKSDIRVTFGFLLDMICSGEEPALSNAKRLWPNVWSRSDDELKKSAGARYHTFVLDPSSDDSHDSGARLRLLETLMIANGIKYIPDAARALIYRKAASDLAKAKDTQYGWSLETTAAKTLKQFGPHVPSIAFVDVYQEIIASFCGNYWGRSPGVSHLQPFIDSLGTAQILDVARMFSTNDRVKEEIFQSKPRAFAISLLEELKSKLTIETHIAELDGIIETVKKY